MTFHIYNDGDKLILNKNNNILEPIYNSQLIKLPLLYFIPMVGFDNHYNRIGYGSGYYDKYLSKFNNIYKIGLAYEIQKLDNIFNDKFDIKMNLIMR